MSSLRWLGLRIRGIRQCLGHDVVFTLVEYASGPPSGKLNASELTTSDGTWRPPDARKMYGNRVGSGAGRGWGEDFADRMPVVVMESVAQAAGVDEADQDQGRCGDGEVPDDLVNKCARDVANPPDSPSGLQYGTTR